MVVSEVPWLATDVFRRRTEYGALDRHPPVRGIIVSRRQQPFDRQPEEHDACVRAVQIPPWHVVHGVERGHRADLEPDLLQFRPGAAQELDGRADREVEAIQASVERGERRAYDLAAPDPPMATVTGAAPGGGGGGCAAATRHV